MLAFVVPIENRRHDFLLPFTEIIPAFISIFTSEQIVNVNPVQLAAQLAERRRPPVVRHSGNPHLPPFKILPVGVVVAVEEAESVGEEVGGGEVVGEDAAAGRHKFLDLVAARPENNRDSPRHESVPGDLLGDVVAAVPAVLERQVELVLGDEVAEVAFNPRWVATSSVNCMG